MKSAAARFTPSCASPANRPASQAIPTGPPPPSTNARLLIDHSLVAPEPAAEAVYRPAALVVKIAAVVKVTPSGPW